MRLLKSDCTTTSSHTLHHLGCAKCDFGLI
jgi:hypothetical protein